MMHDWDLIHLSYDAEDHETRTLRCRLCGKYRYDRDGGLSGHYLSLHGKEDECEGEIRLRKVQ